MTTDEKLDFLINGFSEMKVVIDNLSVTIGTLERRIENIEIRVSNIERRVANIESKVDYIYEITYYERQLQSNQSRLVAK